MRSINRSANARRSARSVAVTPGDYDSPRQNARAKSERDFLAPENSSWSDPGPRATSERVWSVTFCPDRDFLAPKPSPGNFSSRSEPGATRKNGKLCGFFQSKPRAISERTRIDRFPSPGEQAKRPVFGLRSEFGATRGFSSPEPRPGGAVLPSKIGPWSGPRATVLKRRFACPKRGLRSEIGSEIPALTERPDVQSHFAFAARCRLFARFARLAAFEFWCCLWWLTFCFWFPSHLSPVFPAPAFVRAFRCAGLSRAVRAPDVAARFRLVVLNLLGSCQSDRA